VSGTSANERRRSVLEALAGAGISLLVPVGALFLIPASLWLRAAHNPFAPLILIGWLIAIPVCFLVWSLKLGRLALAGGILIAPILLIGTVHAALEVMAALSRSEYPPRIITPATKAHDTVVIQRIVTGGPLCSDACVEALARMYTVIASRDGETYFRVTSPSSTPCMMREVITVYARSSLESRWEHLCLDPAASPDEGLFLTFRDGQSPPTLSWPRPQGPRQGIVEEVFDGRRRELGRWTTGVVDIGRLPPPWGWIVPRMRHFGEPFTDAELLRAALGGPRSPRAARHRGVWGAAVRMRTRRR
jgi:hypothetical protein